MTSRETVPIQLETVAVDIRSVNSKSMVTHGNNGTQGTWSGRWYNTGDIVTITGIEKAQKVEGQWSLCFKTTHGTK